MSDTTLRYRVPDRDRSWLPGLPHAGIACATWPVFGGSACITGLLLAGLVSFVVFLPLTALALNGGQAIAADDPAPRLTLCAYWTLFGLWSATAWGAAWLGAIG